MVVQEEDRSSERRDETVGDFDEEGDEEGDDYSDADDFIVDDEGRPIRDKQRKRKPIFTDQYVPVLYAMLYEVTTFSALV